MSVIDLVEVALEGRLVVALEDERQRDELRVGFGLRWDDRRLRKARQHVPGNSNEVAALGHRRLSRIERICRRGSRQEAEPQCGDQHPQGISRSRELIHCVTGVCKPEAHTNSSNCDCLKIRWLVGRTVKFTKPCEDVSPPMK